MSIVLSLVENKLNKYTFKYSVPKIIAGNQGLQEVWLTYTDGNNLTKSIQGPGWPGNYPLTGTIVATLPSHKILDVRLSVKPLRSGNLQYSNTLNIRTHSGKIEPPLNVTVQPVDTSRSSGRWEVLLNWDNSKNIGSAPVSKLKILYTYNAGSARSTYYSKVVDINEWDSSNSYTWSFSSPYKNQSNHCHFSLSFINESGEESEKADARHDLGPGLSNNLFIVVASKTPDVTIQATPLFNEISWTNNASVGSFIKQYLTIASNRWSKYIGISPTISEAIKSIDRKFYNGIYLNQYTTINDSSKPIMQCTPAKYVGVKLNDGRWNFITVSFNLVFNQYYENNLDRASNWDLIHSTTHHLGHALGIGVYWHLDQLYKNIPNLKSGTIEYPRYRLDGNLFPQTQRIHNGLYRPADFFSWELSSPFSPNPELKRLSVPLIQNPSTGVSCKNSELLLPCPDTTPVPKLTETTFTSYGTTYTTYTISNAYEPPLFRRVYAQDRRFIPLDHIGSLTTDNIIWEELNYSTSPTAPLELWHGDKNQPFVSGLSADVENENYPGSHFGIIDNPLNRRLFTYNHRKLNDIMSYRTGKYFAYSESPRISSLSIAHLNDLGYTELYENQKPGPINLRAEISSDFSEGFITSKLENHDCCRGFSPTQIASWQPSEPNEFGILSENNEMLKIADIVPQNKTNYIIYCYDTEVGCS